MATTSIWPIRGVVSTVINYARNPEKTREESAVGMHQIDNVIQYAANELKTETRAYVTCLNCTNEDSAAREFMETKRLWNKPEVGSASMAIRVFSVARLMQRLLTRLVWNWHNAAGVTVLRLSWQHIATQIATIRILF